MINKKAAIKCNKCKKKIKELPFKCRHCDEYHCSGHHLPEGHNCKWLEGRNEKNLKNWGDKFSSLKGDALSNDEEFGKEYFNAEAYLCPTRTVKHFNILDEKTDNDWMGFIVFIIIILSISLFLSFSSSSIARSEYNDFSKLIGIDSGITYDQFSNISELHWDHMPLTYSIDSNCIERLEELMILSMEKINNETSGYVQFQEERINPDISFHCKDSIYDKSGEYSLADASSTNDPYNTNIITHVDINIYGQGAICGTGYPALEVHELLHGFGFNHNPLTKSIMSPYSSGSSRSCKISKMDNAYSSCLMYIYSNSVVGDCYESKLNSISSGSEYDIGECDVGWYGAVGSDEWCCEEPGMYIDSDGYCSS